MLTVSDTLALTAPPGIGVLFVMAAVAVVALAASLLALRPGHGQHAHAGPGALNVWQLQDLARPPTHIRTRTAPEPEPDEIDWPTEDVDGPGELDGLGKAVIDVCWPPSEEPDYVGRHRLREPAGIG